MLNGDIRTEHHYVMLSVFNVTVKIETRFPLTKNQPVMN